MNAGDTLSRSSLTSSKDNDGESKYVVMGEEDDDSEEDMRATFILINSWLALMRERRIKHPCFARKRRTVRQRQNSFAVRGSIELSGDKVKFKRIHSFFGQI